MSRDPRLYREDIIETMEKRIFSAFCQI